MTAVGLPPCWNEDSMSDLFDGEPLQTVRPLRSCSLVGSRDRTVTVWPVGWFGPSACFAQQSPTRASQLRVDHDAAGFLDCCYRTSYLPRLNASSTTRLPVRPVPPRTYRCMTDGLKDIRVCDPKVSSSRCFWSALATRDNSQCLIVVATSTYSTDRIACDATAGEIHKVHNHHMTKYRPATNAG